ncbi:unnamed protein product [Didymodactylos carnosus]|uniref:ADP-ribosylglycohydrolase n=1 Tax=Didymodactylos carnosus TaxID=1234261 RepID=A0A815RMI3_9BILA|nr:unnamed protein product [Didymodactylos carnosus]CAF1479046.1 unnamed protein product [Didymodactylos carnosus]CAF3552015.1 unnamed protein product [Didymodactylos carnosus]CAF4344467.1 unnamed protein product [Didymodactylos carnosus]
MDKDWLNLSGRYPHEIQYVPPPEQKKEDNIPLDKIVGSLLGLAVGDALGAHAEFRPHNFLQENPVKDLVGGGTWGLKGGQWTDDTSMALCLSVSLIVNEDFYAYDQLVRYKWWWKHGYMSSTGKCFDIGSATRRALEEFTQRQVQLAQQLNVQADVILDNLPKHRVESKKFNADCSSSDGAGNGALMRLAPIPLFFCRSELAATVHAGKSARLTHGDRKAVDVCRFYSLLICCAIKGYSRTELLDDNLYQRAWNAGWFGKESLHEEVIRVAQGSYKKKGGYQDGIRGKGYIVQSLEAALWAFWSDDGLFRKGILLAVNLGDDTDTTAAIYGQLAGACYGVGQIPQEWKDALYAKDFIICLAQWLKYLGHEWMLNSIRMKKASSTG